MELFGFFKKKKEAPQKIVTTYDDSRIMPIMEMFNEILGKGSLPIQISYEVLDSLKKIASVPEWYKQVDEETLSNLYTIYKKWQSYKLNKKNQPKEKEIKKTSTIHKAKEWRGTWEEYKEAISKNEIDEFTHVTIETVRNPDQPVVWLEMDENGEVEEYME